MRRQRTDEADLVDAHAADPVELSRVARRAVATRRGVDWTVLLAERMPRLHRAVSPGAPDRAARELKKWARHAVGPVLNVIRTLYIG